MSRTQGATDGDVKHALFEGPAKLVADGLGNLHVAESYGAESGGLYEDHPQPGYGAALIRRIDLAKNTVSTVAGNPISRGFAEGPLPSTLDCPEVSR